MDADILRLALFIAGVALIVGIYFWDRHKKINARVNAIHKEERSRRQKRSQQEQSEARQEPVWDNGTGDEAAPDHADGLHEELMALEEAVEEHGADRRTYRPLEQSAFEFRQSADDPPSVAEKPAKAVPQKLLQINLVARNKAIDGDLLMRVARDLQLEAGEMEIFHRYQGEGNARQPVFSMASLVEPGTFPFDAMSRFSTPGVTLFAQLPGPCEGQETFAQMLAAAQRLAALLDAEMLDQTRSGLSRQTIEHIKEEIREHSRLVRLARSGS